MAENTKLIATPADGTTAALMWVSALIVRLAKKGLLDTEEVNEIAATAASMCRGNGSEMAARLIENIQPSSVGVDAVAAALDRRFSVNREKDGSTDPA